MSTRDIHTCTHTHIHTMQECEIFSSDSCENICSNYDFTTKSSSGYDHSDWFISVPVLDPATPIDLSDEFIGSTLDYFLLSSERLSQMTKTYNDIDAVTRLLEEKERDLELAARIGKSLLEQNKDLKEKNSQLEEELTLRSESVTQLKHDLSIKNGLLQLYSDDFDNSGELEDENSTATVASSCYDSINERKDKETLILKWELLHEKVLSLEDENRQLRDAASEKNSSLEIEEKKELQLIADCAKQLADANCQLASFQDDIARKSDDSIRQQEEITNLLTQLVDLQRKNREITLENDTIRSALDVSQECQKELSTELMDLKEKYEVLLAAFTELQEDAKRKTRMTYGMFPSFIPPNESLAAELESTLGSEGYESSEFSSLNTNFLYSGRNILKSGVRCDSPDSLSSLEQSFGFNHSYPLASNAHANESTSGDSTGVNKSPSKNVRSKSSTGVRFNLNKLKIVKSLEGSITLGKWRKLATPHLGVLLESQSGVRNKALKDLQDDLINYVITTKENNAKKVINNNTIISNNSLLGTPMISQSQCISSTSSPGAPSLKSLSTVDYECNPGKWFDATCSTYTFTTTSLSRSTEATAVTPSFAKLQLATGHDTPITSSTSTTTTDSMPHSQPSVTCSVPFTFSVSPRPQTLTNDGDLHSGKSGRSKYASSRSHGIVQSNRQQLRSPISTSQLAGVDGLAGLGSLASSNYFGTGVLTKGHNVSLTPNISGKLKAISPTSLPEATKSWANRNVKGLLLKTKTLRKGGFI